MGKVDTRPDITKELLEEYVRKGYSQEKMAIELDVTQSTISYRMRKFGIKPAKIRSSKYDEQIMLKQLQNGWSLEQMAKYFEVCTNTINHWIKKYNLEEYRKKQLKTFDTRQCKTCIYRTRDKHSLDKCSYWSIMGHSRNMGQPEVVCSKYVKGGRKRGKEKD